MIEEVYPSLEVIDVVIKEAVMPILTQLEIDIGKLKYRCSVFTGEQEEYSIILEDNNLNVDKLQPIRIRFRKIFHPNKLRYHIESIISKDYSPKGSGYSGFSTDGSINIDDLTIKKSSWATRYNVWEWKAWKL